MAHRHKGGQFLATAISSIANGATALEGTDFTSREINVENVESIAVQLVATGADAAIAGDVTAYFVASPQKTPGWDTFNATSQAFDSAALMMTTNAEERHSALINTHGLAFIKVMAIANAAGKGITGVNVAYGRSTEVP